MNLKTLTILVAVLSVASLVAWFLDGRERSTETDPRVGTTLVDVPTIERTAEIFIRSNGNEITLENTDPEGSAWVIRNYHDLPIDFNKLATLVREIQDAEIVRFASANPERMAGMDFGDSVLELRDASGEPLLSVGLGRNLSSGGRFIKFRDEDKAYLVSLSAWLDTTAKNWADAALIPVDAADVTRFEIGFESDEPLVLTRDNAGPWSAEGLPEGATLNSGAVNSLLTQVTNLRFTETSDVDSPDVASAREHARSFMLGSSDGPAYTVAIGRRPAPPAEESESDGESSQPEPKAGPVYVFVQSSDTDSHFNERMNRRGYQINEWTFTGMPDTRSAFVTPAPPQPEESSPDQSEETPTQDQSPAGVETAPAE